MASSGSTYYYIILCRCGAFVNAFVVYAAAVLGLAAGRRDLLQVEKVPVFLAFSAKGGLTDLSIYVRIRYRKDQGAAAPDPLGGAAGPVKSIGG